MMIIIEDNCLFCGRHLPGEGYHFKAIKKDKLGNYIITDSWIVIEHIASCYVWICPECQCKPYKKAKNESKI